MIIFKIIWFACTAICCIIFLYKMFKVIVSKKYNWNSCPNDHDTMSRYGAKKCDKCGSEL